MSHTIAQHRRRQPMWFYEKNYRFLLQLLPDLCRMTQEEYRIRHAGHQLQIQILESCPYTQMLELYQCFSAQNPLLNDLRMAIRVYHDARLAEVTNYQGQGRLLARYELPYDKMMQLDEKRQANLLLHDWLTMYISSLKPEDQTAILS